MRPSGMNWALLTVVVFLTAGCVSTSEFEEYKAQQKELQNQVDKRLDDTAVYDAALACESRLDAYQDVTNSDEPIATRRDEPIGTRRDECVTEFDTIFGPLILACRASMVACVNSGALTNAECRACYNDCFTSGAWDNFACPIP